MARSILLLGEAVDPIHLGTGRSPGVVDLPIQRDPLGYPLAFASSVKGALKTLCVRSKPCTSNGNAVNSYGFIDCSKCGVCCCLFGGEPRQDEDKARTSKISVLDLIPFAFPVASATNGFLYITAPPLLKRASLVLEALEKRGLQNTSPLRNLMDALAEQGSQLPPGSVLIASSNIANNILDIAGSLVKPVGLEGDINMGALKDIEALGGLASNISNRLVVSSVPDGPVLVDKALLRVTRVALRRDRKTVSEGALWTEEYLPPGTLFIGGLIEMDVNNYYCDQSRIDKPIEKLLEILNSTSNKSFYVTIGGKETVGKGLIKFTYKGGGQS